MKFNKAVVAISSNTSWYLFNFRKNTILKLIEEGYEVLAFAPEDEYSCKLKEIGCKFVHIDIDNGGMNPLKDLRTLGLFYKQLKENRVEVLLNFTPKNNIYGTLAAKCCGVKVINNIAGLGLVFGNGGVVASIVKMLYKFSQQYASFIFFQNEDDRDIFIEHGLAEIERTERIPGSGVDLSRFTPLFEQNENPRFLLICRMLVEKGVMQYVEVAKKIKSKSGIDATFSLLGPLDVDNPSAISKEQMNSWRENGFVEYLGVSDSVEEVIMGCDCIVLPSYYREGVPKSLLEGAASGKPIITTDNVGCRETVIDGVNGFLCNPKDVESLLEKISRFIMLSTAERERMGRNSRKLAEEKFDEKIVIDRYVNKIGEVLANS